MSTDLEKLLSNLQIEQIDKYLFIGRSPRIPRRIFGGQVLAQALNAGLRTVDAERVAHSMHAYFLRPGDPTRQIVYEVDPIRDGRGFTTRRVVAKQNGRAIFNTSISFQLAETGPEHQQADDGPLGRMALLLAQDRARRVLEPRLDLTRLGRGGPYAAALYSLRLLYPLAWPESFGDGIEPTIAARGESSGR